MGLEPAKLEVMSSFIYALDYPSLFIKKPRNMLLYGPPGTGKTFLVKGMARRVWPRGRVVAVTASDFKGKYFLELLSSKNDLIVESSVKELGDMKSRQSVAELSRLVHAGNQKVRFRVIDALRQIGGKDAVSVIASALEDPSPRIRARAASSLGWMGATAIEDKVIGIFLKKDEAENVRVNAVLALGNMGSTKAIPIFEDALKDANLSKTLRGSIESSLRKLQ